jgi:hypothetical protein
MYERESAGYKVFLNLVGDQNISYQTIPGRAWILLDAQVGGGLYHPWIRLEVPVGLPELQGVDFLHLIEEEDPEENFWAIASAKEVWLKNLSGFFSPP